MKVTMLVATLGFAVALNGSMRASEHEVQKPQRSEKSGRSAVTIVADHGADDTQPEVQKPQRPEKPGRSAVSIVADHGADDTQPEVQKPQRPEKPGRHA